MADERKKPKQSEYWLNNHRQITYQVLIIAQDADCPDPREMVVYVSTYNGDMYVRSMESWMGTNRDGQPRFTFLEACK